jgi:galactonate dehydratase
VSGATIIKVETFVLRLPGDPGYRLNPRSGTVYSAAIQTMLVRVESADGHVGWGEALTPVAAEVPAAIVDHLLADHLIGQSALTVRPHRRRLERLMRERGHLGGHQADALAAVDIALWDLAGHITGRPVAALLGGAFRDDIPTYVTGVGGADPESRAANAADQFAAGVRRFKLHLLESVDDTVANFDAVAAAAPGALIAVDSHGVHDLAAAIRLGRALDDRAAWFFEAPLAIEDRIAHRELAAAIATPVAVGEAFRHRFEVADWIRDRAVDLVQPDVGRTGITEAQAIATQAEAAHLTIAPHHSAALTIALAAGLHLAAASENLLCFEYTPATLANGNQLLAEPLTGDATSYPLPHGPGLGIRVDEDGVRALAAPGAPPG